MYTIVVLLHVLACMALILIVLLQTGKGAEMGAAFGGASQTLFGGSGGATFLGKLTTGAAIVFMITCLGLTYLSTGPQTKSIMEDVPVTTTEAPLLPEAKPIQPAPAPAAVASDHTEAGGEHRPGYTRQADAAGPGSNSGSATGKGRKQSCSSQASGKTAGKTRCRSQKAIRERKLRLPER